jgi:hypothetical protein
MKATLLIVTLIVNSNLPLAWAFDVKRPSISSTQEIFNSKWNFSPLIIKKEGESFIQTKIFKRLMWIEKTPITIIDTNFVYLTNPIKDNDPKKNDLNYIAESMKKSFGKMMKINGSGNSLVVEGPVTKMNRYVKISLVKKKNSFLFITTFARLGLYEKLQPEIAELHDTLLKYDGKLTEKVTPKTTWHNFFSVVDEVQAQAMGDIRLENLLGGSNVNASSGINITGSVDDLRSGIQELNGTIGSLGSNVTAVNANISNGIGVIDKLGTATNANLASGIQVINNVGTAANANAANGIGVIDKLGTTANANFAKGVEVIDRLGTSTNANLANGIAVADKVGTQVNENWAQTNATAEKFVGQAEQMNTNWAESNKILAKVVDPNHMAKVGFYTAAGAALGGVAVNLAVQGVSSGISFLHELFTGEKKKKLEWEDFEKAMMVWDNQLNDLVKMEQVVDNYLAAFEFFEGKNLGNDYVKQLNISMRDMRFDRDIFMEKFQDQNMDISCRKLYYDAADELDQKLKEFDKIIQFATSGNKSITEGPNYFCNQLKDLQLKILGAETQMQDLRIKILVAENQYYGKQENTLEKRDTDIDKVNDNLSNTLEKKKEYDKKVTDRIAETKKQSRSEWLTSCMNAKNDAGKAIAESSKSFFIFRYFEKKSKCNDAFAKVEPSLNKRDEASVRNLASEENLRKDLIVKANNNVEMKLSEEQMNWMTRVHVDAYCYQFAHGPQNKIPAKCSEFPELLYSTSLSKGYEKAKGAYVNKCQDRYTKGLNKLAGSQ